MEKEEILKKSKRKVLVGEMENQRINKGNWLAIIIAGILAVAFMVIEGALGHYPAIFAIGAICYAWASAIYICQYVMAKRPWPVLIGAVLHGIAFVVMVTLYIISNIQAW